MTFHRNLRLSLATVLFGSVSASGLSAPARAQEAQLADADQAPPTSDAPATLLDIPLEDLLTLETTSVAKKRQRVKDAAAAVYVITQDDIRRSAASTIPDLLRMVPGVEVAQVNTGGTAVSIRGFNSLLANSLLVMIDGRSIFVSTLSGIFWDQLLLPLGDIERIEVVRGPGATLWGANAANGVINIITKHSSDSLGLTAVARASTRKQQASLSYGARISETMSFRAYGSVRHDKGMVDATGKDQSTGWDGRSLGARMDWEPNTRDAVTVQTEYSSGNFDTAFLQVRPDFLNPGYNELTVDKPFEGYNVLARWARRQTESLDWSLQIQHNRIERSEFGTTKLTWNMTDADLGVHWRAGDVHDFNFGVGVRILKDSVNTTPQVSFSPPSATDRWVSAYVQDDISLIADRLRLTLGAKLEDNNFTGFEIQPSAKIFFRANPNVALWAGVSRAVLTPSRFVRDASFALAVELPGTSLNPSPLAAYSRLNGIPDSQSAKVDAYEAGFRAELTRNWSLDVAGYYNHYDRLTTPTVTSAAPFFVSGLPFPVGVQIDLDLAARGSARTWGAEVAVKGEVAPWWHMEFGYSHLDYAVPVDPTTGQSFQFLFPLDTSPRDQLRLHNSFDIGDRLSIDTDLRHVSSLSGGLVPAYSNADFRIAYRPFNGLELSLIGENLLKERRQEFLQAAYPAPPGYLLRSISAEIRYRF